MSARREASQNARRTGRSALLALALALTAGCHRRAEVPAGDVAASLTVPSIDAHPFDPATLLGKPSLILFVTPTCPHCLVTIPRATAAAQAAGANVLAVFVAGKAANAAGVVSHTHFPGPVLIDDGALVRRYAVKAVPYTLVLGPDGRARDAFVGEQDEATFRDALADAR